MTNGAVSLIGLIILVLVKENANLLRASLSHGTPPHIHKSVWDVPLPDSDSLLISMPSDAEFPSDARIQGAYSFIALCSLTSLLGKILPLIYVLETPPLESSFRELRRHETALNEWEETLPS